MLCKCVTPLETSALVRAARCQVSAVFEAVKEQELVLSVLIIFLSYITLQLK